jgi:hypothetical protein
VQGGTHLNDTLAQLLAEVAQICWDIAYVVVLHESISPSYRPGGRIFDSTDHEIATLRISRLQPTYGLIHGVFLYELLSVVEALYSPHEWRVAASARIKSRAASANHTCEQKRRMRGSLFRRSSPAWTTQTGSVGKSGYGT